MDLKSFGGLTSSIGEKKTPRAIEDVSAAIVNQPYLPIGRGKSYGDVGLTSGGRAISSDQLDKIVSFDPETGEIVCESGVQLREVQAFGLNHGWMLAVTPGTSLISVGGAIANDVHGKNHHSAGTFGHHVTEILLARSDGQVYRCSEFENPELFRATIGGLGLTGFILEAKVQLREVSGPYLETETLPFANIAEFFDLSRESAENWQETVAWFDCSTANAGRGIFSRANPSNLQGRAREKRKPSLRVPNLPFSIVSPTSLDIFNATYFKTQMLGIGKRQTHYGDFFYPLDRISDWNRIYGPTGFFQFQSVIPPSNALDATNQLLKVIKLSGQGSFLAVLKAFGSKRRAGLLSFAREGITLSLDFPNRGSQTLKLFETLHAIVLDSGGAMNPSKDALMSRQLFNASFPALEEFASHRDPLSVSDLSRRLID